MLNIFYGDMPDAVYNTAAMITKIAGLSIR